MPCEYLIEREREFVVIKLFDLASADYPCIGAVKNIAALLFIAGLFGGLGSGGGGFNPFDIFNSFATCSILLFFNIFLFSRNRKSSSIC